MRTRTKLSIGLCFLAVVIACFFFYDSTRTVTYSEFIRAAQPNYHNTIITVSHYCGSKDGFDYFVVLPPMSREHRYRVPSSDSPVTHRFGFTKDRSKWT